MTVRCSPCCAIRPSSRSWPPPTSSAPARSTSRVLGLDVVLDDDGFACVVDAHGTTVRGHRGARACGGRVHRARLGRRRPRRATVRRPRGARRRVPRASTAWTRTTAASGPRPTATASRGSPIPTATRCRSAPRRPPADGSAQASGSARLVVLVVGACSTPCGTPSTPAHRPGSLAAASSDTGRSPRARQNSHRRSRQHGRHGDHGRHLRIE